MMNRITRKWTADLKGAFGNTPQISKAMRGEQFWEQFAKNTYDEVINHSSDRAKQTAGIDFTIKKETWHRPITVDVKSNMEHGYFYVENNEDGWLRNKNKKTVRIVHLEVDSGWICEYDRTAMIEYLDKNGIKEPLVRLSCWEKDLQMFVKRYNITKKAQQKINT